MPTSNPYTQVCNAQAYEPIADAHRLVEWLGGLAEPPNGYDEVAIAIIDEYASPQARLMFRLGGEWTQDAPCAEYLAMAAGNAWHKGAGDYVAQYAPEWARRQVAAHMRLHSRKPLLRATTTLLGQAVLDLRDGRVDGGIPPTLCVFDYSTLPAKCHRCDATGADAKLRRRGGVFTEYSCTSRRVCDANINSQYERDERQ